MLVRLGVGYISTFFASPRGRFAEGLTRVLGGMQQILFDVSCMHTAVDTRVLGSYVL